MTEEEDWMTTVVVFSTCFLVTDLEVLDPVGIDTKVLQADCTEMNPTMWGFDMTADFGLDAPTKVISTLNPMPINA